MLDTKNEFSDHDSYLIRRRDGVDVELVSYKNNLTNSLQKITNSEETSLDKLLEFAESKDYIVYKLQMLKKGDFSKKETPVTF